MSRRASPPRLWLRSPRVAHRDAGHEQPGSVRYSDPRRHSRSPRSQLCQHSPHSRRSALSLRWAQIRRSTRRDGPHPAENRRSDGHDDPHGERAPPRLAQQPRLPASWAGRRHGGGADAACRSDRPRATARTATTARASPTRQHQRTQRVPRRRRARRGPGRQVTPTHSTRRRCCCRSRSAERCPASPRADGPHRLPNRSAAARPGATPNAGSRDGARRGVAATAPESDPSWRPS